MHTIVIALGGNAINRPEQRGTTEEQLANVDLTARQIASIAHNSLTSEDHNGAGPTGLRIVVTHGNGPQAGTLLIQQEESEPRVAGQSLAVCGAMTQGWIGWMIQNRLAFHLERAGIDAPVCSVITQVLVDARDPDFSDPSKPVGPFYTEEEAAALRSSRGYAVKLVRYNCPKGWRRVVPSPEPLGIVEEEVIRRLVSQGVIVVASGGGGIPVARHEDGSLSGVNAVIDKDKAAYVLARAVGADSLLILTDVEKVSLDYRGTSPRALDRLCVQDGERWLAAGQFLRGSMGPKVEACLRFVRWSGKPAVIGSLLKAQEALIGTSGTRFVP